MSTVVAHGMVDIHEVVIADDNIAIVFFKETIKRHIGCIHAVSGICALSGITVIVDVNQDTALDVNIREDILRARKILDGLDMRIVHHITAIRVESLAAGHPTSRLHQTMNRSELLRSIGEKLVNGFCTRTCSTVAHLVWWVADDTVEFHVGVLLCQIPELLVDKLLHRPVFRRGKRVGVDEIPACVVHYTAIAPIPV